MKNILQTPIFAVTAGGLCFLLVTGFLLKDALAARSQVSHTDQPAAIKDFWDTHNPEVDQLVEDLKREKADLEKREELLRGLETRLASERAELNTITQRVHQLQVEFDQHVVRVKEEESTNLKKLARMYAAMSPEGAAVILKELEDQSIVKIFMFMKDTESAPLLEALALGGDLEAKRAAAISEQLRKTISDQAKSKR